MCGNKGVKMITIHGDERCFDIDFWNGESEKYYDNGKEYYLLQITEWKNKKCVNMYSKYVLAETMKSVSLTILTQLFKENEFMDLLCQQRKIADMLQVIRDYTLGVRV